jgi:hypothetical protein
MAVKRIKVSAINLFGPALIFVLTLIVLQRGHTSLAAFMGIVGAMTWLIGARTVRVVRTTRENPRETARAIDEEMAAKK